MRKTILTSLAALSLGVAAIGAQAQTAAPATPAAQDQARQHQGRFGHGQKLTPEQRAQWQAKRAEKRAQRVAKLHDELRITPAQEAAWKSFVASMHPAQRPARDRAAWASLTAPERMAKKIELHKRRTALMEQRLSALNSFYSVLTPEQKQTFDAKAARMQHRFHGHRGMGGQQRGDTAQG